MIPEQRVEDGPAAAVMKPIPETTKLAALIRERRADDPATSSEPTASPRRQGNAAMSVAYLKALKVAYERTNSINDSAHSYKPK